MRIAFLCLLLLLAPVSAEELFIKNRLFSGPLASQGGRIMVGLESLATSLGADLQQVNGGWFLGRKGAGGAAQVVTGTVNVEGTLVDSSQEGVVMVDLAQTVKALGLELKTNGAKLEISVPTGWAASVGKPASAPGPARTPPPARSRVKEYRSRTANEFRIDDVMTTGRVNVVLVYDAAEPNAAYKKLPADLDRLAAGRADIGVIRVEVGKDGVAEAAKIGVPQIQVYSPTLRLVKQLRGSEMLKALAEWIAKPASLDQFR